MIDATTEFDLLPPPRSLPESEQLSEIVGDAVKKRKSEPAISPVSIADDCMVTLDPAGVSLPLVRVGCHRHLTQLARGWLARAFDPADRKKRERDGKAGGDLFPGTLQTRYPRAHTADLDDPVYVLRDKLTAEDVKYNADRLRAEGRAKMKHADALEAWWASR